MNTRTIIAVVFFLSAFLVATVILPAQASNPLNSEENHVEKNK